MWNIWFKSGLGVGFLYTPTNLSSHLSLLVQPLPSVCTLLVKLIINNKYNYIYSHSFSPYTHAYSYKAPVVRIQNHSRCGYKPTKHPNKSYIRYKCYFLLYHSYNYVVYLGKHIPPLYRFSNHFLVIIFS